MRVSITFRFLGQMILVHVQSMRIPKAPTMGLSARIPHSTDYVIFLDFDNITDSRLTDEIHYLQELFELGDFHVFATDKAIPKKGSGPFLTTISSKTFRKYSVGIVSLS
jgi:hypothetical protein